MGAARTDWDRLTEFLKSKFILHYMRNPALTNCIYTLGVLVGIANVFNV